MKLLILDDQSITRYELPLKVEEVTLIKYKDINTDVETILSFEAHDGKWLFKSNNNVSIKQGQMIVPSITLSDYNCYFLEFNNQQTIKRLFCMPSLDVNLYNLSFQGLNEITIGSDPNCNISYNDNLTKSKHAVIKKDESGWSIVSENNGEIYINDQKMSTAHLNLGDIIFINGLKIIWMNNYIRVNNPVNKILVRGLSSYTDNVADNTKYTPVSDDEANKPLYKDEEYFFHTPRLITTLENEDIEIDSPPSSENTEELPFLLSIGTSVTMVASSLMTGYTIFAGLANGTKTIVDSIPQIIMCVTMVLGSLLIPRLITRYQKQKRKEREKNRQEKYSAYLKDKENKINLIMKKQVQIMNENSKTLKECSDMILNNSRMVWERELNDDDFLKVRLGIGTCPPLLTIKAPEEHFTLDEDNLAEKVYEVVNKSRTLENVPINISFKDKTILAIISRCSYYKCFLDGIVLQLMSLHSGADLKIVMLTNEANQKNWEYMKYLPHCWRDDRQMRFFATNQDEIKNVLQFLEDEYKKRLDLRKSKEEQKKKNDYKDFPPYYIVLTDNYKSIKDSAFVQELSSQEVNLGFSLVIIEKAMKNLPAQCETFIQLEEKESCILEKKVNSGTQRRFVAEYNPTISMKPLSVKLANIPLSIRDGDSVLPTSLSFLDMYNVSRIEQLNILNRWQNNSPVSTLATTVGVHTNGEEFKLDLHEKHHGPHGLVAGSTGSGKSEFIITYILSMALNYHPYEAQFVLIDYKGGGLAGAFENKETGVRIPHLVGTITNLDTSEMNRTLVSIESEMKRRQRKFNEVRDSLGEGTIDIYKYQRLYREGIINEPMAHLFIISDEFAELKQQQPEFMQQLISAARIGRSLGIHLILATQKPAGVVNDQIWSNSKFKVCLKVQDRSDSMEMLKKPDAASIKEAGRFYLQVGYDDYFDIGQSGWAGAKYVPSDVIIKKIDDSINFVDNLGNKIKSINDVVKKETNEELGDQLTNLVKYIDSLAEKENIKTTKLWLDAIPENIYISELVKKYNYKPVPYVIQPVIGEYDNPKAQEQGLLNLPLTKNGNTLIYGQNGSGKENLLTTILWSSIIEHTPSEVNFYIIDCGAESLKMFRKMPHVGEVITIDEPNKMVDLFIMIEDELDKRRDLFADYGGSYTNYLENSGSKLPLIEVIINNYDVFQENFSQFAEGIQGFVRDGSKYGMNFIITTTTTNAVRPRMAQNFANKISLQLPNDQDYRAVMEAPKGLFPAKFFGRGLITKDDNIYEFQTAYICDKKEITMAVKKACEQLSTAYKEKAKRIPTVPEVITLDLVKDEVNGLSRIPIGYDVNEKDVYLYDFANYKFNPILSDTIEDNLSFVYALIELLKKIDNLDICIIDFIRILKKEITGVTLLNSDFENVLINMNNEIMKGLDSEVKRVYLLLGVGQLKNIVSTGARQILNNVFMSEHKIDNVTFILIDSYASYKNLQLENWYQQLIDSSNGIWLGENVASQMAISISNLSVDDRKMSYQDMAVAIKDGKHTFIKHVVDSREDVNEK